MVSADWCYVLLIGADMSCVVLRVDYFEGAIQNLKGKRDASNYYNSSRSVKLGTWYFVGKGVMR